MKKHAEVTIICDCHYAFLLLILQKFSKHQADEIV